MASSGRDYTIDLQCFAARLADVRSFTRVDANVDGESGSLDEGLAAAAELAGKGTFLTVDASVSVIIIKAALRKVSLQHKSTLFAAALSRQDKGTAILAGP